MVATSTGRVPGGDVDDLRGGDYFFIPSITALGMIALRGCGTHVSEMRVEVLCCRNRPKTCGDYGP